MDTRQMRLIAAGEAPLAASELYAAATAIDGLRRELVRSEEAFGQVKREQTGPPGEWLCDQCGFVCSSRTIDVAAGTVGVPKIQRVPDCSNGCGLLRPLTWEESEGRWANGQEALLARAEQAGRERDEAVDADARLAVVYGETVIALDQARTDLEALTAERARATASWKAEETAWVETERELRGELEAARAEVKRLKTREELRPRCDAYGIPGGMWEGVAFCRKGGARVAIDVGRALDAANARIEAAKAHGHATIALCNVLDGMTPLSEVPDDSAETGGDDDGS